LGYSAFAIAARVQKRGWEIFGTSRSDTGMSRMQSAGVTGFRFDGKRHAPDLVAALRSSTHVLISVAPDPEGDPVLRHHRDDIAGCTDGAWLGYLSTVGVYGDHGGAWVDELTPPRPTSERSVRRMAAEKAWSEFCGSACFSLQVFRLAGIYGPGRSAIDKLKAGSARRLVKEGQVFNRIHVDDIAGVVEAGARQPGKVGIYNVSDDLPAPPQDVVAYAAERLGVPAPPEVPFAAADLSPMARSFYSENKRVSNSRIKKTLAVSLTYPTYREGISAIVAQS
jgi:nucleoside-diphosphate-sugar epimerase